MNFCKGLRNCTWHVHCNVQPSGPQPTPSSLRGSGASIEYSPVVIGPAVRAPEAKMLRHTNIGRPTLFQRPTRGNLLAKAFDAKAFKQFYSAILSWRPALHIALPCVKIVHSFRNASLGIRIHDPPSTGRDTLPWSCHGLSESNGVFFAPVGPTVPAQNAKESNHVPRVSHTCNGDATAVTLQSKYPLMVAIGSLSLKQIRPLVWPAALSD